MKTNDVYLITMEEQSEGTKEKVTYERHLRVNPSFDVKETAETYYVGECVGFEKADDFYEDTFKVEDMADGVDYKILPFNSETTDYQVYRKKGNVVSCTLVGSEFPMEEDFTFYFDLNIAKDHDLELFYDDADIKEFTLRQLEVVEVQVYHHVIMERKTHPLVGKGHIPTN
jgi:hypothetical protein